VSSTPGGDNVETVATDVVAVVPYDSAWPRRFELERMLLEQALAPWLEGGVHHIGSTQFEAWPRSQSSTSWPVCAT
jgi:GrpB-like predicted nucleotidyltransferase (UPF0157 family)